MKKLFLSLFLSLFLLPALGKEKLTLKAIKHPEMKVGDQHTDQSLDPKNSNKAEKNDPVDSPGLITQRIKKVFEDFVDILETESIQSNEYAKAVRFLENSLYNEASFESLKLLASVYEQKGDFKNQINVLKNLNANHQSQPESFYLLGLAYKNLYLNTKENQKKKCTRWRLACEKVNEKSKQNQCKSKYQGCLVENKKKAIEQLQKTLKIDSKYVPAYEALIKLFMVKNLKTQGYNHSRESLSVSIDMLKKLKQNKYYIQLCKAYYDNQYLKQSRKICAKSIKTNPKDPVSPLIMALSYQNKNKTDQNLVKTAQKFKESFFVQYQTGFYFMKKDVKMATSYLIAASALQPDHLTLNKLLTWFLFTNKEEERSYEYFLKTCQLTEGGFLREFKKAKRLLHQKGMLDLISKFQKGIDQCFVLAKNKARDKKRKKP